MKDYVYLGYANGWNSLPEQVSKAKELGIAETRIDDGNVTT